MKQKYLNILGKVIAASIWGTIAIMAFVLSFPFLFISFLLGGEKNASFAE